MVCSSCQCATHACNSKKCPHKAEYDETCDMAGTKAEKLAARMQLIHAKLAADAKIVADDDAEERFELQVEMLEADCAEKIEAKELEVANRIDAYVRAKEIELLGKLNAELAARRTELEFCFDASVNNACDTLINAKIKSGELVRIRSEVLQTPEAFQSFPTPKAVHSFGLSIVNALGA